MSDAYQWRRAGNELHLQATIVSATLASIRHGVQRSLREFTRTVLKEAIKDYGQWYQEKHWTDYAVPMFKVDMTTYPIIVTAEISEDMIKRWTAQATAENEVNKRITYFGSR